ncbi:MAG: hypothetical protein CO141_01175 [Candidatus Moranbacteria bacterium CG_4_9_14_3_um_filter_42_9]|nr:MAG: hypothetical protein CO141_01175 [Candidatus Moranbacteria bacterium CG_4_9_14_3_um_filter_42_9]
MYLSIDLGASLTRMASSSDLINIDKTEVFHSAADLNEETFKIEKAMKSLSGGKEIEAISIGIAGVINKESKAVERSPNYPQLNRTQIRKLLGSFGMHEKIFCANDSEMAGLGEAVLGTGSECNSVAYLSLGTGVGGVLIENKKLNSGTKNYEPGHQIINFDTDICDRYNICGSLEAYVSGTAFKKIYKQDPITCEDPKIWFEYGKILGVGILNITMIWNPQCVVIGGGMSEKFGMFGGGVNETLSNITFVSVPKIKKSAFGQGSGLVGGLVLISQEIGYKR